MTLDHVFYHLDVHSSPPGDLGSLEFLVEETDEDEVEAVIVYRDLVHGLVPRPELRRRRLVDDVSWELEVGAQFSDLGLVQVGNRQKVNTSVAVLAEEANFVLRLVTRARHQHPVGVGDVVVDDHPNPCLHVCADNLARSDSGKRLLEGREDRVDADIVDLDPPHLGQHPAVLRVFLRRVGGRHQYPDDPFLTQRADEQRPDDGTVDSAAESNYCPLAACV